MPGGDRAQADWESGMANDAPKPWTDARSTGRLVLADGTVTLPRVSQQPYAAIADSVGTGL